MFAPWRWISLGIGEKSIISERAAIFSNDALPGVKEIKFIYTMLGYIDCDLTVLS